jgi:hypothetical protein
MNLRYFVDHKDFIYSNKIFDNRSDEVWLLKERKQDRNENRSKFSKYDDFPLKFMWGDLAEWSNASVSDIHPKWRMLESHDHLYFWLIHQLKVNQMYLLLISDNFILKTDHFFILIYANSCEKNLYESKPVCLPKFN